MYELIKVTEKCYYIQSPAKIGLVKISENGACLIDSGNDKDAGKKVKKILDANNWRLEMIINTHSHADHIGGNKYLQEQTGCKIYAKGIECDFTSHTILEPSLLYGANPPSELKHKFLLAQQSQAEYLENQTLPEGFEIINLPGHFFDMIGIRTPDDVVYLADCLSSKETLDKYGVGYIYDIGAYLETLEGVKKMKAKMFIPSHAAPCEDISELAQYNIDKVNGIAQKITELLKEPTAFESLLAKLFTEYNLTMTMEQHALIGSTLRSYLTYLKSEGKIESYIKDNTLLWVEMRKDNG